jgi:hypothetical protein
MASNGFSHAVREVVVAVVTKEVSGRAHRHFFAIFADRLEELRPFRARRSHRTSRRQSSSSTRSIAVWSARRLLEAFSVLLFDAVGVPAGDQIDQPIAGAMTSETGSGRERLPVLAPSEGVALASEKGSDLDAI